MPTLFDDAAASTVGNPVPERVHRPVTGWRRDVALLENAIFLDGHQVELDPMRPGQALDVMLALAPEGTTRRLPPNTTTPLAQRAREVLAWPSTDIQTLGARAAAAALLRNLGHREPAEGALLSALLGREIDPMIDWADWVLSARPVYSLQEDSYELTRHDIALLWCGLALCDGPDAFPWLRSGIVIFHECRPVDAQISEPARRVWARLLDESPRPYDFSDWQDRIVDALDEVRGAALVAPPSPPLSTASPTLTLSPTQQARLGEVDPEILEDVSTWFPDATAAGALPSTSERALRRMTSDPQGPDIARVRENLLGQELRARSEELRAHRWTSHALDAPLSAALLRVLLQDITLSHDLQGIEHALDRGLDAVGLDAFLAPWPGTPHWERLPGWMRHGAHLTDLAAQAGLPLDDERLLLLLLRAEQVGSGTVYATHGATTSSAVWFDGARWDSAGRRFHDDRGEAWLIAHVDSALRLERIGERPEHPLLHQGQTVWLDGHRGIVSELTGSSVQVTEVHDGRTRLVRTDASHLEADGALPSWDVRRRLNRLG